MPALIETDHTAEVIWLGAVETGDRTALTAVPREELDLTLAGVAGSFHAGETRLSCSRVTAQYPRGTVIRNVRQLSIVSAEDLAAIAADLGLDRLPPERLGATMVVSGIPDFTHIPPASRLQAPGGATLTVDMENLPCQFPARSIETAHPGHGKGFKPAAQGRRGVTAWVERAGRVRLGDRLVLHVPAQRAWAP